MSLSPLSPSHEVIRFGDFDVDPRAGELRKHGIRIRLQVQPFQVLQTLLEHPGEVVTREELQKRIWPADTFVDFDQGLNNAVKKLREALGDDAEKPRFIETLSKRGYRFIAPVEEGANGTHRPARVHGAMRWSARRWWAGAAIATLISLSVLLVAVKKIRSASASGVPPIHSLAVLPLQNLSADPAQEYFSDGMTDALITDLAQVGSLKVISRTSIMRYKKTEKSLPEIARELNVDGIIEGTVQRSGDRVRITAQLIHGPSDKHIWADSYERDVRDVFALEREVTNDIADRVRARITTQNQPVPLQPRPVNLEALDSYLQGNFHLNKGLMGPRDKELREAGVFFERSIDADPMFAPAYVGLAEAHHNLWWPSSEDFGIFKSAAERALELAPSSSEARTEVALTKYEEWDWYGAEDEYREVITLNPSNAFAHDQFGDCLDAMGRLDEGWKEHELAQELDPTSDYLSWALYRRGDNDRAIERLRTTLQTRPDDAVFHWLLSETYAQKGMYNEWAQELRQHLELVGYPEEANRLLQTFAVSDYLGAMRFYVRRMEHAVVTERVYFPGILAQLYAKLGDKDRAFYWLREGIEHHTKAISDPILEWTKVDPGLASLRADSRFSELIRRMGLPP